MQPGGFLRVEQLQDWKSERAQIARVHRKVAAELRAALRKQGRGLRLDRNSLLHACAVAKAGERKYMKGRRTNFLQSPYILGGKHPHSSWYTR